MVRIRGRQCICGNDKQCKGMVVAFAMFEDPRGGYVELPPFCHDPPYDFLHRMNDLRRAYLRHLAPERREVFCDHTQMVIEEEREFVALHHFQPEVVREISEAGGCSYKVPLTIKPQEIKTMGLELSEEDRVYDLSGQRTQEFFFVPNYAIETAYEDLKRLSKAERSTADITADIYRKAKQAIKTKHKAKKAKAKNVGSSRKEAKESHWKKKTTEASDTRGDKERQSTELNNGFTQLNTPQTAKKESGSDDYASVASLQISDTGFLTKTYHAGNCNQVVNPLQHSETTVQHSNVLGAHRNSNSNGLNLSHTANGFTLEDFPNLSSIAPSDCRSQKETACLEQETSNSRSSRISPMRDMIKQEVQKEDAVFKSRPPPTLQPPKENQSLGPPENNDDNVPPSDGSSPIENVALTDERFKSVPFSNSQTKDASPLTPRRVSSTRNIAAKNEVLGDTTKVYRGGLTRSHSDSPLIPAAVRKERHLSTTHRREKLFGRWRVTPRRTKSDSANGKSMRQQQRRKPVRSKSGSETRRFQPTTYSLPRATKSDFGGRRSSNTLLLSTPEISASKPVSGTTANLMTLRGNDRTRKAMEELYRTLDEDHDDRKSAASNRSNSSSPAQGKRRHRRDGLVAMDGNSLGKLKDIAHKRTRKLPGKTKSDLSAKCARQTSSSPKSHHRIPHRTKSDLGKVNKSLETQQVIRSEVIVKRIDSAKRALKHYVLDCTGGEIRPCSSRSPTRNRLLSLLRPMKKISKMHSSSPAGLTLVNDDSTHADPHKKSISPKSMHSSCPSVFAFDIHSMKSYKLQDAVPSTISTSFPLGVVENSRNTLEIDQTIQSDERAEGGVAGAWDAGVLKPILEAKLGQDCSADHDHEMSFPNRAASCLPLNFHFSYPIRCQEKKKEPNDIDWNELGFYASFPVSRKQNYDLKTHGEDTRVQFSFPRRLADGKTRQESALFGILEKSEKLTIAERCVSQGSQSSLDLDQVFADSQSSFSSLQSNSTRRNRTARDGSSMDAIPEDTATISIFTTEQLRYVFPFFQKKKNRKSSQKNMASLGCSPFILRDFAKTRSDFPLSFREAGLMQNISCQASSEARDLSYDSIFPFQDAHNRVVAENLSIDASEGNEQKVECSLKASADITLKQDKPAAISKQHGHPCAKKLQDGPGYYAE